MTWETKRVLVTVKAYPEYSKKHRQVVCTAGITDTGEFIRLYPINTRIYFGKNKVKKYDWIEVECRKAADEKLGRKESYKVREDSIRIIDRRLSEYKKRKAPWEERNKYVLPLTAPSMKSLYDAYSDDKTSLGLIRPTEIIDFYTRERLTPPPVAKEYQKNILDDSKIPIIDNIPHIFAYRFRCAGCQEENPCLKDGRPHDIMCEDWEIFEAYRSWWNYYQDIGVLWEKLHEKMFEHIASRNIHFFMGMHALQPTWIIIGLYYPPPVYGENAAEKGVRTLDEWT